MDSFRRVLSTLKAAAEPTRLRILALLRAGELNVTDLTDILSQSQPRVSRHLKLLVEADLIERIREGSWAFFRPKEGSPILEEVLAHLETDSHLLKRDQTRLAEVRQARAAAAADYFNRHARDWDRIRSLHVADDVVEAALKKIIGPAPIHKLVDIGTGTGRMLELFAPLAAQALGIDTSAEMLAVARARLAKACLTNAMVRQGDLFDLPVEAGSCDLTVIHQVLHYLDDGKRAIREAAKTLRPGGRVVIIDFAPHKLEFLREEAAHRRLGFSREMVNEWMASAGLQPDKFEALPPKEGGHLTVQIWVGRDPRLVSDAVPRIRGLT